ncbi:MAG: hypothetical protein SAK29_41805 [Scytonema sp. PMC 1069.18]|nr:hypothetical protein [Scytonema sp. PMC 1069.18]MEC4888160.1 hypothetical protein [Scytonema sp. PMC 1070.18]
MSTPIQPDPIRQEALTALTANFIKQGHPPEYAPAVAASIIFQTDLDLRNAQISGLLAWLKQEHEDIYSSALTIVEKTRIDFENRVQQG